MRRGQARNPETPGSGRRRRQTKPPVFSSVRGTCAPPGVPKTKVVGPVDGCTLRNVHSESGAAYGREGNPPNLPAEPQPPVLAFHGCECRIENTAVYDSGFRGQIEDLTLATEVNHNPVQAQRRTKGSTQIDFSTIERAGRAARGPNLSEIQYSKRSQPHLSATFCESSV